MEIIKGGMDGAKEWLITFRVQTADVAKTLKFMRKSIKDSGATYDMTDFHKTE